MWDMLSSDEEGRSLHRCGGAELEMWKFECGLEAGATRQIRMLPTAVFLPAGKCDAKLQISSYRQENGSEFS
jgi:hypothetical protein